MSITIAEILNNHGFGSGAGITIIPSETEPTGAFKEGTVWHRPSDDQIKMYVKGSFKSIGGGGTVLTPIIGSATTTTVTGTVAIPITNYNPEKDILFITQNSTQLTLGVDYRLNKNTKTIEKMSGQWNTGTFFTFMIIANTTAPASDGIMISKYEDDVKVAAGLTNISFNISAYNKATDTLDVYRNNQKIFQTIDWNLASNERSIDLIKASAADDRYHFTVTKKVRDVVPNGGVDGSLITDGTLTPGKFNFAPVRKVNDKLPDSAGNVAIKADGIAITDSVDYYKGTTVEAALAEIGRSNQKFKTLRSNKDANGLFRRIEMREKSTNKLFQVSTLSGGTSPLYTTRTVTYYEDDGLTVKNTVTFTLSYDGDGDLVSEV